MLKPYIGFDIFKDLSAEQLSRLEPLFERLDFPADAMIFEQGQLPINLYVLVRGSVAIQYKPYDGTPITLTRLKRGDVFGWSAVVGSRFYTSGTVALTPVSTLRIRGDDLWKLVREHPTTGKILLDRLASVVSSRWKNSHKQVQALFDEGMRISAMKEINNGRQRNRREGNATANPSGEN